MTIDSEPSKSRLLTLQQTEYRLVGGIRLCHGRDGGLLQDLCLCQVGGFSRDIRVADRGFSSRKAADLGLRQFDCVPQLVFTGSDAALNLAKYRNGSADFRQSSQRVSRVTGGRTRIGHGLGGVMACVMMPAGPRSTRQRNRSQALHGSATTVGP